MGEFALASRRVAHERYGPATACLTSGNLTVTCLLVTNRNSLVAYLGPKALSYQDAILPFNFLHQTTFSLIHSLWKASSLICILRPLCLVCFNLIINSNGSLPENFLFQIRPRDGALPFILPGEWYIKATTTTSPPATTGRIYLCLNILSFSMSSKRWVSSIVLWNLQQTVGPTD